MAISHVQAGADANAATLNAVISQMNDEIAAIVSGTTPLTSPTIASFALAQHDHEDNAGGGAISISALTAPIADNGKPLVVSNGQIVAGAAGGVPAGCMVAWGGTEALVPSGWLLCYGQSLSRTTYATLFAAIGTRYGAPSSSVFSLPDLRGRFPLGVDAMGGAAAGRVSSNNQLGQSGGEDEVTLTIAQLPAHNHGFRDQQSGQPRREGYSANVTEGVGGVRHFTGTNSPVLNTGSGNGHPNMPPYLAMNYIIKT